MVPEDFEGATVTARIRLFVQKPAMIPELPRRHATSSVNSDVAATDLSEVSAPAVSTVRIDEAEAGQRIDNYLLARLKGVPKSRIYRLLRKGEVRVNKGRVKPEYRLAGGDLLRIPPVRVSDRVPDPAPGMGLRQHLAGSVLIELDSMLVINKPAGLAVHGGSGVNLGLIEALRQCRPDDRFLELVHRLDKETSGCLMLARKRSALRHLQQQLREGRVQKIYQALVAGDWPRGVTTVDAPLRKDTMQSGERIVRPNRQGKRAVTHFRVLQRFGYATLVEVELETGRTHQIRVHSQLAGHPLAGDEKYGDSVFNRKVQDLGLKRLFLHAKRLSFLAPEAADVLEVEAPLAEDLQNLLKRMVDMR